MNEPRGDKDRVDFSSAEKPTCPYCEQSVTTTLENETLAYGSGESVVGLHVRLPVRHCEACDFHFIDEVGERIQTEAVYRHHGLLTPWEIRATRERRGLSRPAFAEITGLGEATIKRWETGAKTQNRANDRYLRLLNDDSCWSALERLAAPRKAQLRQPTTASAAPPSIQTARTQVAR